MRAPMEAQQMNPANEASTSRQHEGDFDEGLSMVGMNTIVPAEKSAFSRTTNNVSAKQSPREEEGEEEEEMAEREEQQEAEMMRKPEGCSLCGCNNSQHLSEDQQQVPIQQRALDAEQMFQAMERFASDVHQVVGKPSKKRKEPPGTTREQQAEQKLNQIFDLIAQLLKDWTTPSLERKIMGNFNILTTLQHQQQPPQQLQQEGGLGNYYQQQGQQNLQLVAKAASGDGDGEFMGPKEKKRKRTKFTQEQLRMLRELAEEVGWCLGNLTKEQQETHAKRIGIKVESLKYWFHNTKQKNKTVVEAQA